MYSVQLSEQEITHLLVFLNRADLKGAEALIFVNLIAKIKNSPKVLLKEGEKAD